MSLWPSIREVLSDVSRKVPSIAFESTGITIEATVLFGNDTPFQSRDICRARAMERPAPNSLKI